MEDRVYETLYTVYEVAEKLKVDPTTVRRWIKDGILEAIPLPHPNKRISFRIRKSTFDTITQPKRVNDER